MPLSHQRPASAVSPRPLIRTAIEARSCRFQSRSADRADFASLSVFADRSIIEGQMTLSRDRPNGSVGLDRAPSSLVRRQSTAPSPASEHYRHMHSRTCTHARAGHSTCALARARADARPNLALLSCRKNPVASLGRGIGCHPLLSSRGAVSGRRVASASGHGATGVGCRSLFMGRSRPWLPDCRGAH
jgi:hypothetical protein